MMYLVAEVVHMVTASFLIVILFLGGWHFWGLTGSGEEVTWLQAVLRVAVLLVKVAAVILFFMLVRWSWPRFRFDQLMGIAWRVMLPWGMLNLVVLAVWQGLGLPHGFWLVLAGMATLAAAWAVTSWADPTATDNRPLKDDAAVAGEGASQ
jgi:NADH-quinone oxidoreductase subunit H